MNSRTTTHPNARAGEADGARDRSPGPGDPSAPDPHPRSGRGACVVYHDESCPLCRAEIAVYRRLEPDRPVEFVDVSAVAPDQAVAADLTGAQAMRRFHVRGPDGRLRDGAEAFGLLWRQYRGFRWLGRLMRVPSVRWLAEGAYRVFLLTVRPALQWLVRRSAGCGRPGRR